MRYLRLIRHLSNGWLYLAFKLGWVRRDPLVFRTRRGVVVEVPLRLLQTFKEIFMDECYLRGLGRAVPPRPVVIDVGANAGFFSLFAASRFPGAAVYAFEPMPANFGQLSRNRALNPSHDLTCLQRAVAGASGLLTLRFDPEDAFTTSASMLAPGGPGGETIEVTSVTLGEVFSVYGLDRCDLLKMDCEGAEYDILYRCPDAVLARIDQMALEVHPGGGPDQNIQALEAYLGEKGFRTRRRPVGMLWAWRDRP